jgi:hypothetical protein
MVNRWNEIILRDYECDNEKEVEHLNIDLVTEFAPKPSIIRPKLFRKREDKEDYELSESMKSSMANLIQDYHQALSDMCDSSHIFKSPSKGEIAIYVKYIVYKKLLIIRAPKFFVPSSTEQVIHIPISNLVEF